MLKGRSYKGCEVQAGVGQESLEDAGPVLHPLEPGLHQREYHQPAGFGVLGLHPRTIMEPGHRRCAPAGRRSAGLTHAGLDRRLGLSGPLLPRLENRTLMPRGEREIGSDVRLVHRHRGGADSSVIVVVPGCLCWSQPQQPVEQS